MLAGMHAVELEAQLARSRPTSTPQIQIGLVDDLRTTALTILLSSWPSPGPPPHPPTPLTTPAGDKVVADGLVVESHGLVVDEASLTGESDPIKKNEEDPWCRSGTQVSRQAWCHKIRQHLRGSLRGSKKGGIRGIPREGLFPARESSSQCPFPSIAHNCLLLRGVPHAPRAVTAADRRPPPCAAIPCVLCPPPPKPCNRSARALARS